MNSFLLVLYSILVLNGYGAQDVFETVEAVVGHTAELPCNVTAEVEDDKLNILAWYRNVSATAFYSVDLRGDEGGVTSDSGSRYQLVTGSGGVDLLQILAVVPSDGGLYHCLADFAASPAHKTFVQLSIIEPPRHMWVVHENGTQIAKASAGVNVSQNIGPYYVGDTVHMFCVVMGGKPQANLSWNSESRVLKNSYTPLSEHRIRSELKFGPLRSEDHGRVLTCEAANNNRTTPLSIDVVIELLVPPQLVSVRMEDHEGGRVKAGDAVSLQCRVLGAHPPPPIVWRMGDSQLVQLDQNITVEDSQSLKISDIQLSIGREFDESSLSCCAPAYTRDEDEFICSEKLPLTVLYPPVLNIVLESDLQDNNTLVVTKGEDVRMVCTFQANPAVYQLVWFHEDDILGEKRDKSEVVQAFLELPSITEDDAGEYVCAATNDQGSTYSDPVRINVTYPSYCEDDSVAEYGIGETESINITCNVKANPPPTSYRWVMVNEAVNVTSFKTHEHNTVETEDNVLLYERPDGTTYSTIFCWGVNDVKSKGLSHSPCTFLVSDETVPRPPADCEALLDTARDIHIKCEKGHDGGLPQKFKIIVQAVESDDQYLVMTTMEPWFMIPEPKQEDYKIVISAFNDKGESKPVLIAKDEVVDMSEAQVSISAVSNITTLALSLCGGVLLVALAACGLVLCAHDREPAAAPGADTLAAYTEESNCETYPGSEEESECNLRRTESFRRAMARHPRHGFDVRRTSSFHSSRYMEPVDPEPRCQDTLRYNACRVHSLQNISRKREMDALCDHLVLHLPPETNYNVPKPMNTFYTMPRKSRQKAVKEMSDEMSEITQTSDGFSLPPPPDEFGTYRAGTRIKDVPTKTIPTYSTIKRNNSQKDARHYSNVMNPMNSVGIPTVSGAHNTLYNYSDDDQHTRHQVTTNPFDEDST